jgi:hypothetical protein
MRKYIVDFLKKQNPSIIFFEKEMKILFHYYWRIWLSRENEVYSIFVVYTPMYLLNVDTSKKDKDLYCQLKSLIVQYPSLDDALLAIDFNVSKFDLFFLKSCTDFVRDVKERGKTFSNENCKLLDFSCINSELCIFSLLYEIQGMIDYSILELGRKNYIMTNVDSIVLSSFFAKLFKNTFDIEIISKRGESCGFIGNELS